MLRRTLDGSRVMDGGLPGARADAARADRRRRGRERGLAGLPLRIERRELQDDRGDEGEDEHLNRIPGGTRLREEQGVDSGKVLGRLGFYAHCRA